MLALAVGLAGCGGGGAAPAGTASAGRTLFASQCSGCHTLSGSDAPHRSGGDLLRLHFSRAALTLYTAEMPVRRPLSSGEVATVVDYVLGVQAAARR